MMFNKLLANKKIVITVIALILVLSVGIILLITMGSKETGGKDTDTKIEQGNGEAYSNDDKDETDASDEENDNSGLEVLKPDEVAPENSNDASGSWGDTPEKDTQTSNTNTTDKTDQTEDNNSNETDKENEGKEPEEDEDILEDDITWGDIY